jgi:hypothetical protein
LTRDINKGYFLKHILYLCLSLIVTGSITLAGGEQPYAVGSSSPGINTRFVYDENGIPFYNYTHAGLQRNPLFIANEVIYHISEYKKTNNEISKIVALSNANWLVNSVTTNDNYSILEYEFSLPSYELNPPWRSGLAQGRAIEGLAKAYDITGNQMFLKTAKSLLNAFFVEVINGGVTYKTTNDGWWYEEYIDEDVDNTSRVLNGMISSVISIYNYYNLTGDIDAKFLFDQGVLALKKDLSQYDINGCSYYDIDRNPATLKYHKFHIRLLERLFMLTDDEIFRKYQERWTKCDLP